MNKHILSQSNDHIAMFSVLQEAQAQLPSNLHEFLQVTGFGVSFNHPFCFVHATQFLFGKRIAEILDSIHSRHAHFEFLCAAGDWEGALWTVERPYRPDFLCELIERHGIETLCSVVGSVWRDTESAFSDWESWESIWGEVSNLKHDKNRFAKFMIMNAEDQNFYDKLPAEFTIYRGFAEEDGDFGRSWTLDRTIAEWFAQRAAAAIDGAVPNVATLVIQKAHTLAYFSDRSESEIIVDLCYSQIFSEISISTITERKKLSFKLTILARCRYKLLAPSMLLKIISLYIPKKVQKNIDNQRLPN